MFMELVSFKKGKIKLILRGHLKIVLAKEKIVNLLKVAIV